MIYKILLRASQNEIFNMEADSEEEAKFDVLKHLESRAFSNNAFHNLNLNNLVVLSVTGDSIVNTMGKTPEQKTVKENQSTSSPSY